MIDCVLLSMGGLQITDDLANCTVREHPGAHLAGLRPLSLFTAERVDLSLQRLAHYCATGEPDGKKAEKKCHSLPGRREACLPKAGAVRQGNWAQAP
jgi:hypothetical protein